MVEPYYGGSHRSWVDSWLRHSRHQLDLITHADEFWRWRLRGGAVTLAEEFASYIAAEGRPDAVVVSGMVDVAAFVGIARRALAGVPVAVYVHESQLLYPLAPNQRADPAPALANWRSLIAADAIWFNSAFHRDALRESLPGVLASQPSPGHQHLVEPVFDRSRVLWPGVESCRLIGSPREPVQVPLVLWNQRWDHDKNPHAVFAALAGLADEGIEFVVALAGQNQRPDNADFAWVHERLGNRIQHVGFLPHDDYHNLLLRSDVVASAADHEFFGIAVVEALAAGAVPVLPRRLSFPELIEPHWHEAALYGDGQLRDRLRAVLTNIDRVRWTLDGLRESMARFDVTESAVAHDLAVDELVANAAKF